MANGLCGISDGGVKVAYNVAVGLLNVGGEVVEGGYVFVGEAEGGVSFVADGGVVLSLLVVAEEGVVEGVALGEREGGVTGEEFFHHPAVVLDAGEGVEECLVGDGAREVGEAEVSEFEVYGVGGMDGGSLLGEGELSPHVVEGVGVGGHGGELFAAVDALVEEVDAFGGGDATVQEGVGGAEAEGDDVVVAWDIVMDGMDEGIVVGLEDEDERSYSGGGGHVVEGEVLGREIEGVGDVAVGVVAAEGDGDNLQGVLGIEGEPLANPFLSDGAFEEFPFNVEEVAEGGVGARGLPAVVVAAEGDMRELEEVMVMGFEVVDFLFGEGVDEGDASTYGFSGGGVEVWEVAELGSCGGEGIAHGCHADNDEVNIALAVGVDKAAVEGVGFAVGAVAYEELLSDGFEGVDDGGLKAGVGFLGEGLEQAGGDVVAEIEEALSHLDGIAAKVAGGVPAGDVAVVVRRFVVLAKDEDV